MNNSRTALLIVLALVLVLGAGSGPCPRVGAQDGGLSVTVVRVESAAFPQIDVYASVLDRNGLPVYGLTEAHWTVREAGRADAPSLTVQPDTTQGLDLVLALDVSVEAGALPQIQETARAFIRSLNPTDRLAVIAFADEVQVVQNLAAPEEALQAADALAVTGLSTTLNEAVVQAVALLEASSAPRKAVVVLTDSPDNAGKLAFDAALGRVQEAGVPIHVLGYGPKMARSGVDQLKQLARATGGQPFILLDFQDVRSPLQALALLLHQGYRITFESSRPADGTEHDFSVRVDYEGLSGQSEGSFVAQAGPVQVGLLELADGQTVGGVVDLTASASAPAQIESVAYWLDDVLLGEASEPPHRVRWDSIDDAPGAYTLTVRARDAAGNEGRASVTVKVVHPLAVELTAPERVQPGASLTVRASVEALNELAQVEFLLDGRSLGAGKAAGDGLYELVIDSGAYLPGDHLLAARARDVLGRVAEASQDVQFVAPPTPTPLPTPTPTPAPAPPSSPAWVKPLVGGLSIAVFVAASLLLMMALYGWQRVQRQSALAIVIANVGNMPDRYELRAEVLGDALKTRFLLNGRDLPTREQVEHTQVVEPAGAHTSPARARQAAPASQPGVKAKVRKTMRLGDALADLLVAVASFMPGSLRGSLLRFSTTFRRGRMTMDRVDYASARVSSAGERVSDAGARAAGSAGAGQASSAQTPMVAWVDTVQLWSQTPLVPAGEQLSVRLLLIPTRLSLSGLYTFKVFSRSVERQDESGGVQVQGGDAHVSRASWLFYVLSGLLVVALVMAVAFIVFWLRS